MKRLSIARGQWKLGLLLASFFMLIGDFVVEGGLGSDRIGVFGALFDDYPVASELGDREYLQKENRLRGQGYLISPPLLIPFSERKG